MVHPDWWAVVWIGAEGDAFDVVRIGNWGGVLAVRDGVAREPGAASVDVFDHRGRLVLGLLGGFPVELFDPDGSPVRMQAPREEGRWLWPEAGDYTRERVPPTRRVVEWAGQAEMRTPSEEVHVVPYDLDPNPVSIAMRIRKRIFNEKRAREGM